MQNMQTNLAKSIQKKNIIAYHMQILSYIGRPVIAYIALYNSKPVATQELYRSWRQKFALARRRFFKK